MGTDLNTERTDARSITVGELRDEYAITVVPWLDERSAGLARTTIATIARRHPELRAAILYGSVARHEERPLDDTEPSDVNLLLIVEPWAGAKRIPLEQSLTIYAAAGDALDHYLYPPRDMHILLATPDLPGWDRTFIANVARAGAGGTDPDRGSALRPSTTACPPQRSSPVCPCPRPPTGRGSPRPPPDGPGGERAPDRAGTPRAGAARRRAVAVRPIGRAGTSPLSTSPCVSTSRWRVRPCALWPPS